MAWTHWINAELSFAFPSWWQCCSHWRFYESAYPYQVRHENNSTDISNSSGHSARIQAVPNFSFSVMNNFFFSRVSAHYGVSLINFVYWMFIDLEIRRWSVCVSFILSMILFFFPFSAHPSPLCLFSFDLANNRRIKTRKKSISRAFYHSISFGLLFLIGLHISITRKSFTLNRRIVDDACRWCLSTMLAHFLYFCFIFAPRCCHVDRNVCRSELCAKIVWYRFANVLWGFRKNEQASGWCTFILHIHEAIKTSEHKTFILLLVTAWQKLQYLNI